MARRYFAPAKLNLYLHVVGRRADGLHLLDSLVAFASIGDEITVAPAERLELNLSGPFAPALDGDTRQNLVWRAAEALASLAGVSGRAAIALAKNLPVASGIGGGSSDAAAVLRALAELWRIDDEAVLTQVAASLGSDVPACFTARPVWLGGIGDRIEDAPKLPACGVVLVNPRIPLLTQTVYRAFIEPFSPPARFAIPGDALGLAELLAERRNDLTPSALRLVPEIGDVLARLGALDRVMLARMSGSGATCFALFASEEEAEAGAARLTAERGDWWVAPGHLFQDDSGVSPSAIS
jgi:4-diphosphocytidyl-2-C-methyl-D-erythritol kinase